MTEPVTLPEQSASKEKEAVVAVPADIDARWEELPDAYLGRCPVFDTDTPGGCG